MCQCKGIVNKSPVFQRSESADVGLEQSPKTRHMNSRINLPHALLEYSRELVYSNKFVCSIHTFAVVLIDLVKLCDEHCHFAKNNRGEHRPDQLNNCCVQHLFLGERHQITVPNLQYSSSRHDATETERSKFGCRTQSSATFTQHSGTNIWH